MDYFNESYSLQNRVLFAIISKLMFFTLIFLICKTIRKEPGTLSITKYISIQIFIVPLLSLILFFLLLIAWSRDFGLIGSLPTGLFIPIITILILLLNILVFWDEFNKIKRTAENNSLQLQLQKESDMLDYYRNLAHEAECRSSLIHDIKNHLLSIQSLASSGDIPGTNKYINDLLGSSALLQSLKRSDNDLLNAILYRYADKCRSQNISFDSDIRSSTIDFLSENDMTTLFCNMLDNALEAIEKTGTINEPFIDLIIESRMDNTFTIIKLRNSYNGNELFIDSKGLIQTDKSDTENHGFGMKSMLSVINKYEGDINISPNSQEGIFTLTVTLKNPLN